MKILKDLVKAMHDTPCGLVLEGFRKCDGKCGSKSIVCHDDMCDHEDGECHSGHHQIRKARPDEHQAHIQVQFYPDATHVEARCICGTKVREAK